MAEETQQMDDLTLISDVETMSKDGVTFNTEFMKENETFMDRYLGNLYGDEEVDRSKILSNDVEDSVNSYLVSLARVFLGSGEIIDFEPLNPDNEEDVEEADQKSKYADWLVRGQSDSYPTQYGALFDILLMKFGVVKYFIEETKGIKEESYTAITPEELVLFEESLEGEDVISTEIVERSGDFNGVDPIDFKFKVIRKEKKIKVMSIPPECFIISKDARSKSEAPVVGDDTPITRGELVEMGYSKEKIAQIPRFSGQKDDEGNSRLDTIRDREQGSSSKPWYAPTWASEEVMLRTRYALIDYDGDGIAERRYVLYSGQVLLENEVFDHVPYAIGSSLLMPHRAIGRSIGEQASPFARQNTTLLRGIADNIYAVQAPRIAHNELVNQDDLLDQEHGATIRVSGNDTIPANAMQAIEIPYIGDKVMQVLQMQMQRRADTIGTMITSQGLEADDFNKETATRFEGVQDQGKGKVELVARNIAETYYRDLYDGVIWMATHYQNTEQEIRVLGKPLKINPGDWKFDHAADVRVGLGSGDEDHVVETMSGILNLTMQLEAAGSPLVDQEKKYNTITSMMKGLGISNVGKHFNDPSQPDELVLAQNEILTRNNAQLQQMVEQLSNQNPLAEAEKVKQQTDLAKAQSSAQLDAAKLAEEKRQFNISTTQKQNQNDQKVAVELTKLELDSGKDVEGSIV